MDYGVPQEIRILGTKNQLIPEEYSKHAITRAVIDASGNIIEQTYLDISESPVANDGYYKLTNEYDKNNNIVKSEYWNQKSQPVAHSRGGHSKITAKYDSSGNQTEHSYWGANGRPISSKRYEYFKTTITYNSNGNILSVEYLGVGSQPTLRKYSGYAKLQHQYDFFNRNIETTYFGKNGELINASNGYAKSTRKFDESGNLSEEAYLDQDNNSVVHKYKKYAKVTRKFNAQGNITEEAFWDAKGKLTPKKSYPYYSKLLNKYNDVGDLTETTLWNSMDLPLDNTNTKLHKTDYSYDTAGNLTEVSYWTGSGKPSSDTVNGFYKHVNSYDSERRKLKSYFWKQDKISGLMYQYNEFGNVIESAWWGPDQGPENQQRMIGGKYAREVTKYNSRGKKIEETHFEANGEPGENQWGTWSKKMTYYDKWGYLSGHSFWGKDGKLALQTGGYAVEKFENDAYGQQIQRSFWGDDNQPIIHSEKGYFQINLKYDAKRNLIQWDYMDTGGNPIAVASSLDPKNSKGYAKFVVKRDSQSLENINTYWSVNGERVNRDGSIYLGKP